MRAKVSGFTLIELLVVIAIIAILAAILFPVFLNAKASAQRSACMGNIKQLGYGFRLYEQDFNSCYPASATHSEAPCPGAPAGYASWVVWLRPYVKSRNSFNCPGAAAPFVATVPAVAGGPTEEFKVGYCYSEYINFTYWLNSQGVPFCNESAIREPKYTLLLADGYRNALTHDWNDDDDLPLKDGIPSGMNRVRYADRLDVKLDANKKIISQRPIVRHNGSNILFCDLHVGTFSPDKFKFAGNIRTVTSMEWPIMWPDAKAYH